MHKCIDFDAECLLHTIPGFWNWRAVAGVIAPADAAREGIPRGRLSQLAARGVLERVGRGRYRLAGGEVSEQTTLALAASAAPQGVVCLLSALQYHGIGVQSPAEVWLALARGAWRPRPVYPPLRVVYFSAASFPVGIEHHSIEGRDVAIYVQQRRSIRARRAGLTSTCCWRATRSSASCTGCLARPTPASLSSRAPCSCRSGCPRWQSHEHDRSSPEEQPCPEERVHRE